MFFHQLSFVQPTRSMHWISEKQKSMFFVRSTFSWNCCQKNVLEIVFLNFCKCFTSFCIILSPICAANKESVETLEKQANRRHMDVGQAIQGYDEEIGRWDVKCLETMTNMTKGSSFCFSHFLACRISLRRHTIEIENSFSRPCCNRQKSWSPAAYCHRFCVKTIHSILFPPVFLSFEAHEGDRKCIFTTLLQSTEKLVANSLLSLILCQNNSFHNFSFHFPVCLGSPRRLRKQRSSTRTTSSRSRSSRSISPRW